MDGFMIYNKSTMKANPKVDLKDECLTYIWIWTNVNPTNGLKINAYSMDGLKKDTKFMDECKINDFKMIITVIRICLQSKLRMLLLYFMKCWSKDYTASSKPSFSQSRGFTSPAQTWGLSLLYLLLTCMHYAASFWLNQISISSLDSIIK